MKRLLLFIVICALGWASYWWIGSTAATRGFTQWFEDRRADGWIAEAADITTQGFPSRFDTTLTQIALADPRTGLAYEAPFLQIFALSYRPQHLIAVWPKSQTLATPYGRGMVTTEDMRASLVLEPSDSLAINRANLAVQGLDVALDSGARFGAETLFAAIETIGEEDRTYHFGLDSEGLYAPAPKGVVLQSSDILPDRFSHARADITVQFSAPWDRYALEQARPQPERIDIKRAEARWGQLTLKLAGSLTVDGNGVPTGQIAIKAENWRDILKIGVASGLVPDKLATPLEQGLALLAGLTGNRNSLDLPLGFTNGFVTLGPIPLGPAPKLIVR